MGVIKTYGCLFLRVFGVSTRFLDEFFIRRHPLECVCFPIQCFMMHQKSERTYAVKARYAGTTVTNNHKFAGDLIKCDFGHENSCLQIMTM